MFFAFPISKELLIKKKRRPQLFKLHQALFIYKLAADKDGCLGWGWSKVWLVVQKSWFFCNSKHFSQNMTPCYLYYFCIFFIFHFFQIIMVSLFLARYDQYLIMFTDSNVFKFTNFPFKTKYNKTAVYSVSSNYLFSREKQGKNCWNNSLIKSTVYLLIFHQNLMIFKGSPKSLKEFYFTGELRLGES